jgi:monovalent cation:H+ antiporter-2, CPA2 family
MELEHLLRESVVLLGSAVAILLLASRLRIPPLVALLITGLVIGPSGLGWVADTEQVEVFAEIGVVLLLFVIGLELSLAQLKELRRVFFVGGGVQAALTIGAGAAAALALGIGAPRAVFLGCVVALSSTAIVLKLYDDRRETEAPHGRASLGILLFQDFLIVPMIVIVPVLAGAVPASPTALAVRFGGALAAIGAVFAASLWLAPRLFERIARTRVREAFVLGSLVACLALAWLTHSLGFSLALGAFLAGIIVSETEYGHQVVADVAPFRELFASLFFISIGMLVDLRAAWEEAPGVVLLALAILVGKAVIVAGAVAAVGLPSRTRILTALGLAQVGEFSFVLMEVGRQYGILGGERYQLLLAAAVVTMIATPVLVRFAPALAGAWERWRPPAIVAPAPVGGPESPARTLSDHVVIVGFGVGGRLLARVLREAGIRYVVLELNAATVRQAGRDGHPMLYGDASRRDVLHAAGIERARVVVFVVSDAAAVRRSVVLARAANPGIHIVVRTRRVQEIEELRKLGADDVVAEEFETAIEVFTMVLEHYHVPRNVVRAQIQLLRGEGYEMLRTAAPGRRVSEAVLGALEAGTTDVFRIEPGGPAAGLSLRDLDLRKQTGATVLAVVRGETPHTSPAPDTVLEVGDDLVLVGSHAEIDRAFVLLGQGDGRPGSGT